MGLEGGKRDKKSKKDKDRHGDSSRTMSKKDRHASQSVGAASESSKRKKGGKKDKKGKKDKGKKKRGKKHKKKKKHGSDSSSSNSSDDTSDASSDWSLNDGDVDYGDPERISDGSDQWEGRSAELYNSDNAPDYPLNDYHLKSRPRILVLEDFDENGDIV